MNRSRGAECRGFLLQMLYFLLSKYVSFPLLGTILNSIYYTLIYTGIIVSCIFIYKRLTKVLGYSKSRIAVFILLVFLFSFPAGVISSRAANMFYYSVTSWSTEFFWEQFINGRNQTFHASLVLPIMLIFILMSVLKIKYREGWDTIFLHVPMAHAFGRTACFLVGCCYGHRISCSFLGKEVSFNNPVPLYAVILNILLYLFLKRCFNRIYRRKNEKGNGKGTVAAFYLIGYGIMRFFLEMVRKEKIIAFGLTQAQLVMIVFILSGGLILYKANRRRNA
jgi:phosphatidylglycerol:prolipoprotein diacylglycerol transferase